MTEQKMIFLTDKPVTEDELGAHANIAELLVKALLSDGEEKDAAQKSPIVLGLFGGWGTGKSSIIHMFDKEIKEKQPDASNVVFDAWAFSNAKERFGPNLLIALAENLLDRVEASEVRKDIDRREETIETTPKLSRTGQFLFTLLMLVIIGLLVVSQSADSPQAAITGLLISSVLLTGILNWFLPRHISNFIKTTKNVSFNELDHFRGCFNRIINNSKAQRISVVIDNLDRVEAEDALEMMRMVKSFVVEDDSLKTHDKTLLFIIPVDDKELAKHLKNAKQIENAYDFLNKFINLVLYVPNIVHQNIIGYTKKQFNKIAQGLDPNLDQETADVVSFILAKAARKSPRQVKILINSFVLFWNSVGLSIKQGKSTSISAKASAVFVGYRFLMQELPLTPRVQEIISADLKSMTGEAYEFITRVQEFTREITGREWLQLVQLQTSEGERSRPDFVEIYDLILDSRFKEAEVLVSKETNLIELLSNLYKQAEEDGEIAIIRVCKWALFKLRDEAVAYNDIPFAIRTATKSRLEYRDGNWPLLIDSGLGKFIFSSHPNAKLHQHALDLMLDSIRVHSPDDIASYSEFLIEVISSDEFSTLSSNPGLQNRYENAVFALVEKSPALNKVATEHISRFQNKELGEKLAELLIKNIFEPAFELADISFASPEGEAVITFSKKFLEISNPGANKTTIDYWLDVCHRILVNCIHHERLAEFLPNDEAIATLISRLSTLTNPVEGIGKTRGILATEALLVLHEILEKTQRETNRVTCENTLNQPVLPQVLSSLEEATISDSKGFFEFIEEFPKSLSRIATSQIVQLLKYEEFQILPILRKIGDPRIEKVLAGLVKEKFWGASLTRWLSVTTQSEEIEFILKSALTALASDAYKREKYEETVKAFAGISRSVGVGTLVTQHAMSLIGKINWSAPDSSSKVVELVENLTELEIVSRIEGEALEAIRTHLSTESTSISENFLSLLPQETQEWLVDHLVVDRAKGKSSKAS